MIGRILCNDQHRDFPPTHAVCSLPSNIFWLIESVVSHHQPTEGRILREKYRVSSTNNVHHLSGRQIARGKVKIAHEE